MSETTKVIFEINQESQLKVSVQAHANTDAKTLAQMLLGLQRGQYNEVICGTLAKLAHTEGMEEKIAPIITFLTANLEAQEQNTNKAVVPPRHAVRINMKAYQ